ncbi:dihydrofolate reductase [Candidatus Saccharibacteria bacterium]|nr:dihydrofolate reductase [Candidatus Saccharibacteria bacterium]
MFSIIAAVGKNRELGKKGDLIFHLKDDMKFFRETTSGHKIVMGRKTWESLPSKLPNRTNIVVTSRDLEGPDEIVHDINEFITDNKDTDEEIFIIGGGKIYAEFLPVASKIYLTEVDAEDKEADTYFPEFDKTKFDRKVIKKGSQDDLTFDICLYQR